jgi:hypothetical protein
MGFCLLFVIPSVYLIVTGAAEAWKWWFSTLFFGLGCIPGAYLVFDRRPQIVISELGIFDRNLGRNIINWQLISSAYIKEVISQPFICLELYNDFEPISKKGRLYPSFVSLNKDLGFQEVNISLGNLNVDAGAIQQLISLLITAEQPERTRLIASGWNV